MDPLVTSALIGAGSKLAGQLVGGGTNNHAGRDSRQRLQEAVHASIGMKVEEAKKYGISPLYALGAPTFSPAGVAVGGDNLGATISDMGADISRAVAAGQTAPERELQALTLEKAKLENRYLWEQINSLHMRTRAEMGTAAGLGVATQQLSPPQWTPEYTIAGIPLRSNPYVTDSQTGTNRFGESEIMEMLNALTTIPADAYWSLMGSLTGSPHYRKGNRLDIR